MSASRRIRAGIVVSLVALVGGAASIVRAANRHTPTAVVAPGSIHRRVVARGRVEPRGGVAHVRATTAGIVRLVAVGIGDRVDRDTMLALVDRGDSPPVTLTSPFAGRVLSSQLVVGDTVGAGSAAFEIADTDRLTVVIEFDARDAVDVRAGDEVDVAGDADDSRRITLRLRVVAPHVEDTAATASPAALVRTHHATRLAWADVPPGAGFIAGQPIEARFALPLVHVPARVPRGAVTVADGRAYLDLPAWGPFARRVPIALGAADDEFVAVDGIAAGTRVRVHEEMGDE